MSTGGRSDETGSHFVSPANILRGAYRCGRLINELRWHWVQDMLRPGSVQTEPESMRWREPVSRDTTQQHVADTFQRLANVVRDEIGFRALADSIHAKFDQWRGFRRSEDYLDWWRDQVESSKTFSDYNLSQLVEPVEPQVGQVEVLIREQLADDARVVMSFGELVDEAVRPRDLHVLMVSRHYSPPRVVNEGEEEISEDRHHEDTPTFPANWHILPGELPLTGDWPGRVLDYWRGRLNLDPKIVEEHVRAIQSELGHAQEPDNREIVLDGLDRAIVRALDEQGGRSSPAKHQFGLELDDSNFTVSRKGETVQLTETLFRVFAMFASGRSHSTQDLTGHWPGSGRVSDQTARSTISRLNNKIEILRLKISQASKGAAYGLSVLDE